MAPGATAALLALQRSDRSGRERRASAEGDGGAVVWGSHGGTSRVPVDAGAGGRVAPGEGEGIHASDGSPALSLRRVEIPTEKRATPEATPSISRRLAGSSDL